MLEAVRKEQEPSVEIDRHELLPPEFVHDADHGEAEEALLVEPHVAEQVFTVFLQFFIGQRS